MATQVNTPLKKLNAQCNYLIGQKVYVTHHSLSNRLKSLNLAVKMIRFMRRTMSSILIVSVSKWVWETEWEELFIV